MSAPPKFSDFSKTLDDLLDDNFTTGWKVSTDYKGADQKCFINTKVEGGAMSVDFQRNDKAQGLKFKGTLAGKDGSFKSAITKNITAGGFKNEGKFSFKVAASYLDTIRYQYKSIIDSMGLNWKAESDVATIEVEANKALTGKFGVTVDCEQFQKVRGQAGVGVKLQKGSPVEAEVGFRTTVELFEATENQLFVKASKNLRKPEDKKTFEPVSFSAGLLRQIKLNDHAAKLAVVATGVQSVNGKDSSFNGEVTIGTEVKLSDISTVKAKVESNNWLSSPNSASVAWIWALEKNVETSISAKYDVNNATWGYGFNLAQKSG